jgi:hypothetical protein
VRTPCRRENAASLSVPACPRQPRVSLRGRAQMKSRQYWSCCRQESRRRPPNPVRNRSLNCRNRLRRALDCAESRSTRRRLPRSRCGRFVVISKGVQVVFGGPLGTDADLHVALQVVMICLLRKTYCHVRFLFQTSNTECHPAPTSGSGTSTERIFRSNSGTAWSS